MFRLHYCRKQHLCTPPAKMHKNSALLGSAAVFLLCHSCKIYLCPMYIYTCLPLSSASICASNMKNYSIVHIREKNACRESKLLVQKQKKRS